MRLLSRSILCCRFDYLAARTARPRAPNPWRGRLLFAAAAVGAFASPAAAASAAGTSAVQPDFVFGIPVDFILFGLTVSHSNMYPEARSVGRWLRHGWHVAVAYVFGFFVMPAIPGWNPDAPHKKRVELPSTLVTLGSTS